jgi:hypothetical protein
MLAVAPLDEVQAVRRLVLIDVSMEKPIPPTARVTSTLLDRRFRLDSDRAHRSRITRNRPKSGLSSDADQFSVQ